MTKELAKKRKQVNWPALIIIGLAVTFIVGVWVNSYRVSHATAAISSTK